MKERLGHGNFLPWLDAEFGMSERSSRRFMEVARSYGSKSATVADLAPKALYELASANVDVQAEVERRIAEGEIVTVAEVQRLKREAGAVEDENRQLKTCLLYTSPSPRD